jgi:hypothetical protein
MAATTTDDDAVARPLEVGVAGVAVLAAVIRENMLLIVKEWTLTELVVLSLSGRAASDGRVEMGGRKTLSYGRRRKLRWRCCGRRCVGFARQRRKRRVVAADSGAR